MRRLSVLAIAAALFTAGCSGSSSSPTTTSPTKPTFSAILKPSNEVPPVTNAEASGSGTATITFDVTRDASNNVTAANVTFVVNLSGFPPGTTITAAHIHEGDATCACPVRISTGIASGANVLTTGTGSFSVTTAVSPADLAQAVINNPAGFYFNVHSTLNGGGFARGQLVKVQ